MYFSKNFIHGEIFFLKKLTFFIRLLCVFTALLACSAFETAPQRKNAVGSNFASVVL